MGENPFKPIPPINAVRDLNIDIGISYIFPHKKYTKNPFYLINNISFKVIFFLVILIYSYFS
jgi:hypothetical protein